MSNVVTGVKAGLSKLGAGVKAVATSPLVKTVATHMVTGTITLVVASQINKAADRYFGR